MNVAFLIFNVMWATSLIWLLVESENNRATNGFFLCAAITLAAKCVEVLV